jgi:hypothetical protein
MISGKVPKKEERSGGRYTLNVVGNDREACHFDIYGNRTPSVGYKNTHV